MQQKPTCKIKSIQGHYTLHLELNPPDKRKRDIGNFEKAVSDWLQSMGIVENDNLCQHQEFVWCEDPSATYGCRVTIKSFDNPRN